jgi:demethylsterigmatocystin 6-O-methyltransferase
MIDVAAEQSLNRWQNLTMASIRVSLDLGIFNILSENDKPISLEDLATRTSADPVLLGR